ncbi:IS66 family insertion sequence element accessory protein TnpB [Chitinimonas viridis]|uniref:IS66 family insertion sequence element accessory protein TnpB n=1 Tax=Chitinimonas viridis TaxID=664880 RepID=A0ABT8B4Y2_9NEIS|nr:IS66 family insertion sequence element accessory protein TnpB [Chitinimonas viridis]MDN3576691.1 IS66 family insertion sequence element accessory protein TnpB [Chitinimonas viridis]
MLAAPQRAIITNQPGDMRHSIDGLALLAETVLKRSRLSGELFVFLNRTRDTVNRPHERTKNKVERRTSGWSFHSFLLR